MNINKLSKNVFYIGEGKKISPKKKTLALFFYWAVFFRTLCDGLLLLQ